MENVIDGQKDNKQVRKFVSTVRLPSLKKLNGLCAHRKWQEMEYNDIKIAILNFSMQFKNHVITQLNLLLGIAN